MDVMMSGTIPPEQHMMELKVMYTNMTGMMDMMFDMVETDYEWIGNADSNIYVTSIVGDLKRFDDRYKIQTL